MNDATLQVRDQRLWFAMALRGAAGALVGLVLLSNPWRSPRAIGGVFAAYVLVDGVLSFYSASRAMRSRRPSSGALLIGVIDAVAAVVALTMPAVLPLRLAGGLRAIASGACDALRPGRRDASELVTMGGIAGVGFGVLLLGWPGSATVALPWLLGLEAMVSGALLMAGAASEALRRADTQGHPLR